MAKATKARFRGKQSGPKLVFRENGASKGDGAVTLKETEVEFNWTNINPSQSFKTVFLGDSDVGKTCLAKLFVKGEVESSTINTIGFDHHVKEVLIDNERTVKLQIWDTAGMEQFRNALVTKYYRNADGIVLVYDITRRASFEHLEDWIKEVQQYCVGGLERIRMILIGNKLDLEKQREVSSEDVQRIVRRYQITNHTEMTAKQLSSLPKLEAMFVGLAQEMTEVRERIELTKSAKAHREGVITLEDDWEIINTPVEAIPHYAYRDQDNRLRRKAASCSRC